MKNFDEFSNGIKLNESEIRFLNDTETELETLGQELSTYMEDQGLKNPGYEVNGDTLTIELGGDISIKKQGDKYIVSMPHNEDETVEDIHSWFTKQVASHLHGAVEYNESVPADLDVFLMKQETIQQAFDKNRNKGLKVSISDIKNFDNDNNGKVTFDCVVKGVFMENGERSSSVKYIIEESFPGTFVKAEIREHRVYVTITPDHAEKVANKKRSK